MKKVPVMLAVLLIACTKNPDVWKNTQPAPKQQPESCSFGMVQFNTAKRAPLNVSSMRKPGSSSGSISVASAVILLDFDGEVVSNTSWNTNGDIVCAPANLFPEQMERIVARVTEDFQPFNVVVTTDEAIYQNVHPARRQRVIVTETWEWYGQTGGTSFIGSFTWSNDTPCFVFGSLLGYDEKKIGEACSHEAGHTLGLRHQSGYADCVFTAEYNAGAGSGIMSWAPIMGNAYYRNLTTWHNGPNPFGCTSLQDDVAIIVNTLGYKADDYPNNTSNNMPAVFGNLKGIINNAADVDFFYVNSLTTTTVTAIPYNLGNEEGANMDLQLQVYDWRGKLVQTSNNTAALSASLTLNAGRYFIAVLPVANAYATTYGMMGRYTLNVQ